MYQIFEKTPKKWPSLDAPNERKVGQLNLIHYLMLLLHGEVPIPQCQIGAVNLMQLALGVFYLLPFFLFSFIHFKRYKYH